ncbi:MAG TPA: DNA polymerase III subunit, partial [Dehalococcoidia bacterium]|nr:DNA polymerase III subunit [Dehalococcoidia bacterium]
MTWHTIGQERAIAALRNDLAGGQLAHAYLFTGPAQAGKATLALELAQALNCMADVDERPCQACTSCTRIARKHHADVEVFDSRSPCDVADHNHERDSTGAVRICQIRRVERQAYQAPFEGTTRLVIIDPADALTNEAANAFLKTLEEPPANTVLVLVAVDAEGILPTVRSRCRTVALSAVPAPQLAAAMVAQWGASSEEADRLARMARGRPGWARTALEDEGVLLEHEALLDRIEALAAAPRDERLAYAESLAERWFSHRATVQEELAVWRAWWRDVLV